MRYLIAAMLVVVGVIHLLPLSDALGGERLAALYGFSRDSDCLRQLQRLIPYAAHRCTKTPPR